MGVVLKRIASAIIVAALCFSCCAAIDVPEPSENFYVADYANVLSEETVQYIIEASEQLYERTGAQIVVATVDFVGHYDMESYANEMLNQWGIGSADKNNGVLLLLSIGDDDYYMARGVGIEQVLTAGICDDILYDYLETDFAGKDYDKGVYKTYEQILSVLNKHYGTAQELGDGQQEQTRQYPQYQTGTPAPAGETRQLSFIYFFPALVGLIALMFVLNARARTSSREFYGSMRHYWNMRPRRRRRPGPPMYPPGPTPPGYNPPHESWTGTSHGSRSGSTRKSSSFGSSSHRNTGGGGRSRGGGAGRRKG